MKQFLTVIILCLSVLTGLSQEINYGVYIGTSFSKWSGDTEIFAQQLSSEMNLSSDFSGFSFTNEARIGFSFGGFIEYDLTNQFSIRPELLYVQKGTRFHSSGSAADYDVNMNIIMQNDYLELPVLLKLTLSSREDLIQPYIYGGPSFGYAIRSKIKGRARIDGESDTETEDFDGFKDFNLGLNVGGGIKYKEASIEVRYQKGLDTALKDDYSGGFDVRENFFSINLLIHQF